MTKFSFLYQLLKWKRENTNTKVDFLQTAILKNKTFSGARSNTFQTSILELNSKSTIMVPVINEVTLKLPRSSLVEFHYVC